MPGPNVGVVTREKMEELLGPPGRALHYSPLAFSLFPFPVPLPCSPFLFPFPVSLSSSPCQVSSSYHLSCLDWLPEKTRLKLRLHDK
jgi:hypothetical protein